ncbi:MAG: 50S ribosomal protein L6, partial [Clostridiales bacterium]|nr:50S ribosomal protein L6 [Clostridiales bacterium]
MSRIGRMPIQVPAGVEIQIGEGNVVTVKGPKGTLEKQFHPDMNISVADNVMTVTRPDDEKLHR